MKYFLLHISLLAFLLFNEYYFGRDLVYNTNAIQSKDSISVWIKFSKNKSFPYNKRKAYVDRSFLAIERETNDSLQNIFLLEISLAYYDLGDLVEFRRINKQSTNLSKKLKDSKSLAFNYWDLAEYFSKENIKDSAYYNFYKAQKIYESVSNDSFSGRMLLNMAIMQSDVKDFTGSEITTIKAISLLKPLAEYKQLYRCYNNLGINFNNLEDYDNAIESHNTALEYQQKIKEKNTFKENSLNNLGVVFKNSNDFEKAIKYYKTALKTKDLKNTNAKLYAKLLDNLAYSKFKLNDTLGVMGLFTESLKIRDSIHDDLGIAVNKLHLAEYYAYLNNPVKATQYALETKELASETKNYRELLPSLLLLAELDKTNGLSYTNQYIQLNDSLQKQERSIRNKFALIQFETEEFISKNKRLTKEFDLMLLTLACVILFGALTYVSIKKRIKNKELLFVQSQQKANEEIYNLMLAQQDKLDEGRKNEKKRISEELHDGVLGKLFGTRLLLGSLNSNKDEDSITKREKCIDDLQEIEEEVRNVSHELNSESLISNFGFINMIEKLLEQQSSITNFSYELMNDQNIIWEETSSAIKMNLYRIIQEAIQNINKYSKAKKVTLKFRINNGNLLLEIADDGIGFNSTIKRKGIGLKNMESRINKLEGELQINSQLKKGTLITIEIPF